MVIQSASVPGYYYYQNISHSRYIGASSPFSSHLFHGTDKFLLKDGKNGCLETWCFSSDPALYLTLEIVYLCVCVFVYVKITLYTIHFLQKAWQLQIRGRTTHNYVSCCRKKFIFFTVIKKKFKKLTKNKLQVRPHNLNNKI